MNGGQCPPYGFTAVLARLCFLNETALRQNAGGTRHRQSSTHADPLFLITKGDRLYLLSHCTHKTDSYEPYTKPTHAHFTQINQKAKPEERK